jgi:hypothetical protein
MLEMHNLFRFQEFHSFLTGAGSLMEECKVWPLKIIADITGATIIT